MGGDILKTCLSRNQKLRATETFLPARERVLGQGPPLPGWGLIS
jgi:hypothetical protein